jgi:SAM-dependent methyltransferase
MTSLPLPRRLRVLPAAAAALLCACSPHSDNSAEPPPGFDPARFVQPAPPLDAPQVASDYDVVDAMLALAEVRPDDDVLDLGSGDGRVLIAAARVYGARGLGVDIDPAKVREAVANARRAGVSDKVSFRRQDLFETPLANAEVVTLYLTRDVNLRLRPRILAQMQPGTRVVSEQFDMGDWRPDAHRRVGDTMLYMWTVPARLAGSWTLTLDGHSYPLVLTQHYQEIEGTFGADSRVGQGWVAGRDLRFVAELDGRDHVFEGRFDGSRLVSTQHGSPWQAVRAS